MTHSTPALAIDPTTAPVLIHPADSQDAAWWRHAVIYQIYPRSWADGSGDGIGDLPGVISRLPYLRDLGVDAVWLSPFYPSPQADAGYDVADYRDVAPLFGSLDDADTLLTRAHELGLKVLIDLVPNHSSDEHPWFQAALAAGPGSAERDLYMFRPGRGVDGNEPPNNWLSVFRGPAWTQVEVGDAAAGTVGQWYLHLFDTKQPDWNWENPTVRAEFESVLRFWLDRGVDGFRVDVAHSLVKDQALPDWQATPSMLDAATLEDAYDAESEDSGAHPADVLDRPLDNGPMWDQDGVHEIYRSWREVLNSYNPVDAPGYDGANDRILCAEAWVEPVSRAVLYVRDDEMHQAFNFDLLLRAWKAEALRRGITASLEAGDSVGAPTTWVMSNHDVVRHATRLGYAPDAKHRNGIGANDPQPDEALGLRRARAATALLLALPGSAYLYQGEELGLPEHTTLSDEFREDPVFFRSGRKELGRDGCRVPMPWEADAPGLGFSPTGATWLPQPSSYRELAVDRQAGVPGSTLELYRTLLRARREHDLGTGSLAWIGGYGPDVVACLNVSHDGTQMTVLTNFGDTPVPLPEGTLILSSAPLTDGLVGTDVTVWVRS